MLQGSGLMLALIAWFGAMSALWALGGLARKQARVSSHMKDHMRVLTRTSPDLENHLESHTGMCIPGQCICELGRGVRLHIG